MWERRKKKKEKHKGARKQKGENLKWREKEREYPALKQCERYFHVYHFKKKEEKEGMK